MSNFVEIKDKDGVTLGQLPVSSEGGRLRNVVYITETAQYEKPAWLKFVIVKGVGGGGGGGGAAATTSTQTAYAGGGQAGGYFEKLINAADLAASETVTIGAGGDGGAAGANAGQTGGATSFGVHCSASGGEGAPGRAAVATSTSAGGTPGTAGGVATGGDVNIPGNAGGRAMQYMGANITFGVGAASLMSAEVVAQVANDPSPAGSAYGGGGGGACNNVSQSARPGGNGAPGIVIIEEYE